MPTSFERTGRRLGFAVLSFVLATILVVTLDPFRFRVPHHLHLMWWDGWFDPIANVALFAVPGFLYALARQGSPRPTLVRALLLSAIFSGAIECAQVFEPLRYPSPTDVASNTLGGVVGAAIHLQLRRVLGADSPVVSRLALELPLMGLVYLVVPLAMLVSLSGSSALSLLLLAAFMGVLVGHVQRYRFGPLGMARPSRVAAMTALAFLLGAMPALPTRPRGVAAAVCVAALFVILIGAVRSDNTSPVDRRFESRALRYASPFLVTYLWYSHSALASHTAMMRATIVGHVESYAGFVVLGYVLAEWLGRREWRFRWVVAVVGGSTALVAFACVSMAAVLPHALAGVYGGWIYHLQRDHVRALAASQRERAVA